MKLLREIFKKEEIDTFGLDIGSSSVKLVQLSQANSSIKIKKVGFSEIEPCANPDDVLMKERNIKKAVDSCFNSSGIEAKNAVCGVGGAEVAVKNFTFPVMPTEEVAKAVYLEAEQVCPFDIAQSVIDYNIVSIKDKISGVLVASTIDSITRKTRVVKAAQLNPIMVDSEALSLLNCYNTLENPPYNKATAILDIGSGFSTMIISYDSVLPFVRELETSGGGIINSIKQDCALSEKQIKDILFESKQSPEGFDVDYQLITACQGLLAEIEETLKFYERNYNKAVEEIFVCGGYSRIVKIIELVAARTELPVKKWNPLESMGTENGSVSQHLITDYGSCFAVAAGLALRRV